MISKSQILNLVKQYKRLNLHSVIDYDRFNQYAISHHSTAIEGSTLSLLDTELLLEKDITPKGKSHQELMMVKDHHKALLYVLSLDNAIPLSLDTIKTTNALVMANTGAEYNTVLGNFDSSKGEIRRVNNRAGNRTFPNYDKVLPLLDKFISSLNSSIAATKTDTEKYSISFKAHFDLVSIHPFMDGNGRTSRLMMNLIQKYFELPLSIVFKEDRKEYITALEKTRKEENINVFNTFMFSQLSKQLSSEIKNYKKKDNDLFLSFL